LTSDRTKLATALQTFASAYQEVATQVEAQMGPSAGMLSGDYLIRAIHSDLRELSGYSTSGVVKSLADVGIKFNKSLQITFDQDVFNELSESELTAAFQFFGSETKGFGALASKFRILSDPISGMIKTQQDGYLAADRRLQDQIAALEDRINELQISMASKLEKADALLATLESQQSILDASLQSAKLVTFGKSEE
jgi:flagellar capping protein FliD